MREQSVVATQYLSHRKSSKEKALRHIASKRLIPLLILVGPRGVEPRTKGL